MKMILLFILLSSTVVAQNNVAYKRFDTNSEKMIKYHQWSHLEIWGYGTDESRARFFYKAKTKEERDSVLYNELITYDLDPGIKGDFVKSDKGDYCESWQAEAEEWYVNIYSYKNQYDKYMIYIHYVQK